MYDGLTSEHIENIREKLGSVVSEIQIQHRILLKDLGYLLEPIREHGVGKLRERVTELKQLDSDAWWAIGELLSRAISIMLEYDRADEKARERLLLLEQDRSKQVI